MVKNRTIQIIYQTVYCTLGIVGVLSSIGFFDAKFYKNFYIYFTNISNYFCVIIIFFVFKQTIIKKSDSYIDTLAMMEFFGLIMILITFFVFNLLLAKDRSIEQNMSVNSILFHDVLPLMYTLHWLLFYKKGQVKWFYPITSMIIPVIYLGFIYLRGWLMNWKGTIIYPYFFLNVEKIGVVGVLNWVVVLLIIFLILGYTLYFIDRRWFKIPS